MDGMCMAARDGCEEQKGQVPLAMQRIASLVCWCLLSCFAVGGIAQRVRSASGCCATRALALTQIPEGVYLKLRKCNTVGP